MEISWPTIAAVLAVVGGGGLVGLLGKMYALRKQIDDKRDEKSCVACRDDLVGKLQALRDELHDRPRRESIDKAFSTIRELEARVVAGEKATLELKGDLKLVLGATAEMKQMLAQLQSDVSVALRRTIGRGGDEQ